MRVVDFCLKLCSVVYSAAQLWQRVGTHYPHTAPGTPLSVGSPAHILTPQRTTFAVPGNEVSGSMSEAARRVDADLSHRVQMTGSADDSVTRRKGGMLYDGNYTMISSLGSYYECLHAVLYLLRCMDLSSHCHEAPLIRLSYSGSRWQGCC